MMIRISLSTWAPMLLEERGFDIYASAKCISAFELGGFVGGLAGGALSDALGGRRGLVMCLCSLACAPLSLLPLLGQFGAEGWISPQLQMQAVFLALGGRGAPPPHARAGLMLRQACCRFRRTH